MANEAAEATEACVGEVRGFYEQAFRAVGEGVKAAFKAQEDAVKMWGEAVSKAYPTSAVGGDWVPLVQKNAEDYLHLMESSYRRNADVVKKAVRLPGSGEGVEKNGRELLEASMEAARENIQDWTATNVRVAQSWGETFKRGVQSKAAVGK